MNFLAHLFAGPERLLPLLVPRLASAVADGETSVPASLPGARWALTFDEGQSSRPLRQARAAQFGLTPETAFSRAHANLRRVASPADLLPHPSDPLLRVCALPDGSGPNRLLALDLVLPEADPVLGVLAAVPTTDLLLLSVISVIRGKVITENAGRWSECGA